MELVSSEFEFEEKKSSNSRPSSSPNPGLLELRTDRCTYSYVAYVSAGLDQFESPYHILIKGLFLVITKNHALNTVLKIRWL